MAGESTLAKAVSVRAREPLAGAYFWVLAFFVLYCARPEDWIPGLSHLHLARIVGLFAIVAFVMSVGNIKGRFPKVTTLLILLLVQLGLASLFSPVWRGGAFRTTLAFAKVVLIIMVMAVAVTSLLRLRRLIFVQTVCVAIVAIISIRESHLVAGRLEGALNGIYQNPNDLAISIVLTLPFCLMFLLNTPDVFRKIAWAGGSLLMVYALLRTGSRAGLLALVVAAGVCLWEFGVKGRRSSLLVFGLAAMALLFLFAGARVMRRFSNTTEYNGDAADYQSAQLRKGLLIRSLKVTLEHPLFGIGPGNFPVISGAWEETHDVYTEFSAEGGIPALVLFLLVYWSALTQLGEVRRLTANQPEMNMPAAASRAGLIAFAVAAFFYPDAYQFFLYFVLSYATALHEIVLKRGAAEVQKEENTKAPVAQWTIAARTNGLPPASQALPVNLRGGRS
ncbi:MAG TPA: O-antigen ligase family protein [Terriglobia bacterium]|nr:O-antigen ligase family protein [Terriglobia bacterium]